MQKRALALWLALLLGASLTLSAAAEAGTAPEGAPVITLAEQQTVPENTPAPEPTAEPAEEPTPGPTAEPTPEPTAEPAEEPTPGPTAEPTPEPTEEPTPEPTAEPAPAQDAAREDMPGDGAPLFRTQAVSYGAGNVQPQNVVLQGRTLERVAQAYEKWPLDLSTPISFTPPDFVGYTTAGDVSAQSRQIGLNAVNLVRYVAGLEPVVLDEDYNRTAQYGSALMAARDKMEHKPVNDTGIPQDFFRRGYEGTSSSNLATIYGASNLARTVQLYMEEGSRNMQTMGHRRWVLNPEMRATGFGYAKKGDLSYTAGYSAMYAFDFQGSGHADFVPWPTENTPYELSGGLFTLYTPDQLPMENIRATIHSQKQNRTYTFFGGGGDGYFYFETSNYGSGNCVIFGLDPDDKNFDQDDRLDVEVSYTGIDGNRYSIRYTVSFCDPAMLRVAGFVARLYRECLGREPDEAGAADWCRKLSTGAWDGSGVAMGFVFSEEFKNKNYCNEHYLTQLYNAIMGRGPDDAGMKDWLNRMANGLTREEAFNGFVGSVEFDSLCRQYGIRRGDGMQVPQYGTIPRGPCAACGEKDGVTQFVERLYQVCFNREADKGGLADWTQQLWDHVSTGTVVAHGFAVSTEMENLHLSDEQYVEAMYRAFFGREYDAAGKADWLGRMHRQGWDRERVFYGFAGSPEFDNLCRRYGITR